MINKNHRHDFEREREKNVCQQINTMKKAGRSVDSVCLWRLRMTEKQQLIVECCLFFDYSRSQRLLERPAHWSQVSTIHLSTYSEDQHFFAVETAELCEQVHNELQQLFPHCQIVQSNT